MRERRRARVAIERRRTWYCFERRSTVSQRVDVQTAAGCGIYVAVTRKSDAFRCVQGCYICVPRRCFVFDRCCTAVPPFLRRPMFMITHISASCRRWISREPPHPKNVQLAPMHPGICRAYCAHLYAVALRGAVRRVPLHAHVTSAPARA